MTGYPGRGFAWPMSGNRGEADEKLYRAQGGAGEPYAFVAVFRHRRASPLNGRDLKQSGNANGTIPTKVLEKHWPDVPRWRDVRDLTAADFTARTGT